MVDDAVRKLLQEAEFRAEEVISAHRSRIEGLVAGLEEQETLHREQIDDCLGRDGPKENETASIARIT